MPGRMAERRELCYFHKYAGASNACALHCATGQAARLAGVARSTWQAWEDPARGALPDVAALAAVADAARVDPAAALDWLTGGHDARML